MEYQEFLDLKELSEDEDFLELTELVLYRQPAVFHPRPNHMEMWSEEKFSNLFRLSKRTVMIILGQIKPLICCPTDRNHAVSAEVRLLLTLRFYALGSFIEACRDFGGIHKGTASRIVHLVSKAIASLRPKYVWFPSDKDELHQIQQEFHEISGFPRCVGAIDCTHVKIQSPGGEKSEQYRNRMGYFSFNVQVISDAKLRIRNLVCRWPGASYDFTVFSNSKIRERFENKEIPSGVLIGDRAYLPSNYLITELPNATTRGEELFNESLSKTRNTVERCFGLWKRRFTILARGINVKISRVETIVVACAVLHNIACMQEEDLPTVDGDISSLIDEGNFNQPAVNILDDNTPRISFIEYFNRLV